MATLVERQIVDARGFNGIRPFEEQNELVDNNTLKAIAAIFVEHQMHKQLGAGLLHRHETITEGNIMLHEHQPSKADICQPTSLSSVDKVKLVPEAWFLNEDGSFQGYEYNADGQNTEFKPAFAAQLREFLVARGLEKQISIVSRPAANEAMNKPIEFSHPSGSGTISVPIASVSNEQLKDVKPVTTSWNFDVNELGIIECKGGNVCAKMTNGNHKVFQDSKASTEPEPEG